MKIAVLGFCAILLTGCSSQTVNEDSDEFKMNQYYECVQRYENQGLYTPDQIENVCRVLRP